MNLEEKLEYSLKKKDQGNKLYGANRFREAIEKYDNALKMFRYDSKEASEDLKKKIDTMKVAK